MTLQVQSTSKRCRLPLDTAIVIAFSSLNRRNDVAKAEGITPATVSRLRFLVAHCLTSFDDLFMRRLAESFERERPLIVVTGLAADATKEKLFLPLSGLPHNAEATRSSWNVLVSTHRFSRVQSDEELGRALDALPWKRIDLSRPNIPIVNTETSGVTR